MRAIAIIPARMGASRFPNKPLAKIAGMPMVGHCWHRTRLTPGVAETYIATCDAVIMDYAASIGAKAIMTSDTHTRASDRTAEAMLTIENETGAAADVVVMVQGDEPLIMPEAIGSLLPAFSDPSIDIANLMGQLRSEEDFRDKNNVKVVTNNAGDALYFSREPIPSNWKNPENMPMHNQQGIIAFRRNALIKFSEAPQTPLEQYESIDMNRVLEYGGRIRMVLSTRRTIGVDTAADLAAAEALMPGDPLFAQYSRQ